METEAIFSYCETCNSQVELTEEGKYSVTTPESKPLYSEDIIDTIHYTDIYHLLRCPKCNSPFLYLKRWQEMPAEWNNETAEPEKLYPNSSEIPLSSVPPSIKKAFEDAFQAHKVGLYAPSVLMCRKTIEAICFEKGITKGNLKQKILKLKEKDIIGSNIYNWADSLRVIGNDAAHEFLPNISKEDSRDTIDFTESVILTTFILSVKFEEFTERREASKTKNQ